MINKGQLAKDNYRQDEAGTPFGITVDHQSIEDNTVTLRDRDSMKQDRISIERILNAIQDSF